MLRPFVKPGIKMM